MREPVRIDVKTKVVDANVREHLPLSPWHFKLWIV